MNKLVPSLVAIAGEFALLGLGVAGSSTALGESPAVSSSADSTPTIKPLAPAEIERCVTNLGSQSRADRQSAETTLIEGGSAVLEYLPALSSVPDPAVRDGLDRVIRSIEQRDSEAALIPQTANWSGLNSWEAAIQTLSRETGNPLSLPAEPLIPLVRPLPTTPVSFWDGVHWIETHTDYRYASGGLTRAPRNSVPFPASLSGPFRVQLVDHSLRTTAGGIKLLRVKLRVMSEPRLRPLFLMAAVDEWTITEPPQTLAPFAPQSRLEIPASRDGSVEVAFDFVVPDTVGQESHGTVEGVIELTLAARTSTVTFSDLLTKLPLTRRRGESSVSLLAVKTSDAACSMRVASAFPQMTGLFESYRAGLLAPELTLEVDPDQPQLPPVDVSQIQEDPEGIVLEFHFATPLPSQARLHARLPTTVSTQKIPFRFEQVSLPSAE